MVRFPAAPIVALIAIAIWFGSALSVNAQTGELIGQVFDPQKNILPKTDVLVENIANGNQHTRVTDKNGYYRLRLHPGDYKITASKPGFLTSSITFTVQLNQNNVVDSPDITLGLATLTGQVTDPFGNGLFDARVEVTNNHTGELHETATDHDGNYTIPYLATGDYKVIARMMISAAESGFLIRLDKEKVVALPVVLHQTAGQSQNPASGQGTVRSGRVQLVHLFDATRSDNFNQQQILSLPLGGATYMRTFDELALLVPGVAPPPYTPGVHGPGLGFGIGAAGEFSVNGMRARSNNFSIDGSDNNDPDVGVRRQGFVGLVPQSLESINDFSISTLLWDAELGRNFGGQVNAVSKYGENAYHGQAYAFFTDSRLNARNAFNSEAGPSGSKDPFTRTQAGFVIGGPIIGKRTQFFGSFEHQQINASTEQHFSVPRVDERRFLGLSRFIVIPGSQFPFPPFGATGGATPLGHRIFSFYPAPNNAGGPYGENTYTEVLPADGKGLIFSVRLTRQLTERNALNARYNFTDDNRVLPSVNRAIRSTTGSESRSQNLSLIFDSEITGNVFNLARLSFGRTRLGFPEYPTSPRIFSATLSETVETIFGPQIVTSSTGPIGELLIEPFSPVGVNALFFPQGRVNNTFQYADSISWQRHAHLLKFGGDIRRIHLNSFQDRLYRPQLVFDNGIAQDAIIVDDKVKAVGEEEFFPGVNLAALGLPTSISQTITAGPSDSTIGLRFTEYNSFFNDNWRLRPNLTLDIGLRYEYNTVPREVNNRIEDSITLQNLPSPGNSFLDTPQRIAAFSQAVDSYRAIVGGRTNIYNPDRNNFGPHLGFAWDPFSSGKTSIRAGYGIYYDAILGSAVSQSRNVFPREIPFTIDPFFTADDFIHLFNPPTLSIFSTLQIPLIRPGTLNRLNGESKDFVALLGQLFLQSQNGGGLAFTLPDKDLRSPYAQHWHLTLEREIFGDYFFSAAYVGTKGTKLTRLTTPNLGPNPTPTLPVVRATNPPTITDMASNRSLTRPNPALGPYQIIENSASSNYNALQLEARKRYSHGYTFTVAYTWSHAIDDVSDLFPIAGAPVLAQDQKNFKLERGNANFDVRHRVAVSFIWDLPFYHKPTGGVGRWLGDWQIAWILQALTAQPFTLNVAVDANLDRNLTDRLATIERLVFSKGHGARRVAPQPDSRINDFFLLGRDGFIGRNTVRGDNFINWDLALNKNFRFSDKHGLEFRTEFFNLLNRANFGLPIRTLGAPGFGSAVDTANPSRIIQLAIKYKF